MVWRNSYFIPWFYSLMFWLCNLLDKDLIWLLEYAQHTVFFFWPAVLPQHNWCWFLLMHHCRSEIRFTMLVIMLMLIQAIEKFRKRYGSKPIVVSILHICILYAKVVPNSNCFLNGHEYFFTSFAGIGHNFVLGYIGSVWVTAGTRSPISPIQLYFGCWWGGSQHWTGSFHLLTIFFIRMLYSWMYSGVNPVSFIIIIICLGVPKSNFLLYGGWFN